MVDFQKLLSTPMGEAEPPKLMPVGDWPGVITHFELGESKEKKTPFIRYEGKYTGMAEEAEAGDVKNLDAKKWRKDYYVNPNDKDSFYDLQTMLKSIGLGAGRSFEELIPEAVGASVKVRIQHAMMTDRNGTPLVDDKGEVRMRAEVRSLTGA